MIPGQVEVNYSVQSNLSAGAIIAIVLASLVAYLWISICLFKIAKKMGVEPAWLAFVPIGNLWVMCKCGGYGGGWFLLMMVPCANIFFLVIVWMKIARFLGKKDDVLYGILMIVPIANYIIPGILAFGETGPVQQQMPPYQQPPAAGQQPPYQPPPVTPQAPPQAPPPAGPQGPPPS